MRKASDLVDRAMGEVLMKLRPGVSELEIVTEIDYQFFRLGAEATSFPTNVYIFNPRRAEEMVDIKGKTTHPDRAGDGRGVRLWRGLSRVLLRLWPDRVDRSVSPRQSIGGRTGWSWLHRRQALRR